MTLKKREKINEEREKKKAEKKNFTLENQLAGKAFCLTISLIASSARHTLMRIIEISR